MLENKKISPGEIKRTLRKVQAYHGERSMTIVLPKDFASLLGIGKGDYLKVEMNGSRLILEKADI
jgi:AbrB family looped-hinge helix DNA binding protein